MENQEEKLGNYHKIINIIEKVSPKKTFQIRLIVYFILLSFVIHIATLTMAYLFNNPIFLCEGESQVIQQKIACQSLQKCHIKNIYSLTAHLDLYCGQNKLKRNLIKSMKGIGQIIGLGIVGFGSDYFGKRKFLHLGLFSINICFVFLLFSISYHNTILINLSFLSIGLGYIFFQSISYIYITRFLTKQTYQQLTVGICLSGTGLGLFIFGLITSMIQNPIILIIVSSAPILILSILSLFLQEDPYYLLRQNRISECQQVIKEIGQINEADLILIENTLENISQINIQEQQNTNFTVDRVFQIFRSNFQLFWLIFVLGIVYLTSHLSEASFHFTAQQVGYSYQSNLSIMGIASILGNLTFIFVLKFQEQRKRGFILVSVAELLLSCLYLTSPIKNSKFLQTILIFILKFLKNWTKSFFLRMSIDYFSKDYQTTFMSIILLVGKIGTVIDPHIIQFQSDNSLNVIISNYVVKFIFGGCLLLFVEQRYYQFDTTKKYNTLSNQDDFQIRK